MDWFKELYDDFRMRTGFGNIPEEQTKKEVDFIIDVLGLSDGAKVLDLFCGTGRHSIELCKRGYHVTGIEYNSDYLRIAREKAMRSSVQPSFIQGDVRDVDFGKDFDAVIIMYQSFGYFEDEQEKAVIRKLYTSLKPNGKFIMEILNRDWILRNYSEHEEQVFNGVKVVQERTFDIFTSRVNTKLTRYEGNNTIIKTLSWRLYSAHELKNILDDIGFSFVAGYSNLEKSPLTLDTRLMRLVFQK